MDPHDSSRFIGVEIDSRKLYTLEMKAHSKPSNEASAFLLNGVIDLIFDKETLANSCGLGLRGKKDRMDNRTALGMKPVEAIRGTVITSLWVFFCQVLIES